MCPERDGVVFHRAVKAALQFATETSPALQAASREWLSQLVQLNIDAIDYMEVGNEKTQKSRPILAAKLGMIRGELATRADLVKDFQKSLSDIANWSPMLEFNMTGWMYKSGNAFAVASKTGFDNGTPLYVLIPTGSGTEVDMVQAGIFQNGFIANTATQKYFQSGRPIYTKPSVEPLKAESP